MGIKRTKRTTGVLLKENQNDLNKYLKHRNYSKYMCLDKNTKNAKTANQTTRNTTTIPEITFPQNENHIKKATNKEGKIVKNL